MGLLYLVSVPWYRPVGQAPQLWLGLPDWVATALLCYAAAAVLTAAAWLLTDVRDGEPSRGSGAPGPQGEPPA